MSKHVAKCVLFAGPSLSAGAVDLEDIELRGPARRGDIAALIAEGPPRVLAVADGVFHQALAVGHAELRDAVQSGWQVWGLSSLGAIRACEMRHLGVRGYGAVYRRFVEDERFSDDEVALLHRPESPYDGVSEPLIHLRLGLDALESDRILGRHERQSLVRSLKKSWYGDRTLGRVRRAIVSTDASRAPAIDAWIAAFDRFRVKTQDLEAFLRERPWL